MKKFKLLLVVLLVACFVTGCKQPDKARIDMDHAHEVFHSFGFTVDDVTSKYGFASKAYIVEKDDVRITILQGDNYTDVQGVYVDEAKNTYLKLKEGYKKTVQGGGNWNSLQLSDDEHFFFVAFVDNTYITLQSDIKNKSKMLDMVDKLGF